MGARVAGELLENVRLEGLQRQRGLKDSQTREMHTREWNKQGFETGYLVGKGENRVSLLGLLLSDKLD